jgi:hypothetical protein
MADEYRLVPVDEVPGSTALGRRGIYTRVLEEFLASDMNAAKVEMGDRKPRTMQVSLLAAVRKGELKDKVHVAMRGQDVYLVRLPAK